MTFAKTRLTVTVDPHVVQAGREAVAARQAGSLSAWVNLALEDRAAKDRRLRALGKAIAAYESAYGTITADEIARQERADRATARVVRGSKGPPPRASRARRGAA